MIRTLESIKPEDFTLSPLWFFSTDDQFTIENVVSYNDIEEKELIVKTDFLDQAKRSFSGYIYWGESFDVEYAKPVIFLDEKGENQIAFWHGIREPGGHELELLSAKIHLPISYKTAYVPCLKAVSGWLDGLYYMTRDKRVACTKK